MRRAMTQPATEATAFFGKAEFGFPEENTLIA
jgi:hypothetical protein